MHKNNKSTRGITLIALVITIIVLLILAGVSIAMLTGQNGILTKTNEAKTTSDKENVREELRMEVAGSFDTTTGEFNIGEFGKNLDGIAEGSVSKNTVTTYKDYKFKITDENQILMEGDDGWSDSIGETETPIDTESYVANYADFTGPDGKPDGTVDGIIYADLITGATGDGQWTNEYGNYTIPTIATTESKKYYISQKTYEGKFGKGKVISPITGTTGKERFYVMALEDFNKGTYYNWYYSAYSKMSDYQNYTSQDFGKGKENTDKMIKRWNDQGEKKEYTPYYGTQDAGETYKDVWGQIQTEVAKGWYVPSRAEWAAFGGEIVEKLNITTIDYDKFGLSDWYWSSSQYNANYAFLALFNNGYMSGNNVNIYTCVRLAATF